MKICSMLFAMITVASAVVAAPLAPWGSNSIPDSVGWVFEFEGKRYDSELKREALLSSPSWSPEKPLPLSIKGSVPQNSILLQLAAQNMRLRATDPFTDL
jgi:hypothetical protein